MIIFSSVSIYKMRLDKPEQKPSQICLTSGCFYIQAIKPWVKQPIYLQRYNYQQL